MSKPYKILRDKMTEHTREASEQKTNKMLQECRSLSKTILFHLLLSLRRIILSIAKLFAFCSILTVLAIIFIDKFSAIPTTAKLMVEMIGIISIAIYWFYDYLVLYFKPTNLNITLFK